MLEFHFVPFIESFGSCIPTRLTLVAVASPLRQ
jgi:hypothetical protein